MNYIFDKLNNLDDNCYLTEGIVYNGQSFDVNFFSSTDTDIVDIALPYVNQSKFDNNVYFFGYKFKSDVPSKIRTKFIHWIKGIDETKPDEFTIENLVALPITALNRLINLSTFSCTLYPRSGRSDLTRLIHRCIFSQIPNMDIESFELVKSAPKDVTFNWKKFNADYDGEINDHRYNLIKEYIEKDLLPKIHSLDYFSIAQNVKYKYRPYISNYLNFETEEQKELFKSLNGGNILIIDDINTSGSTLKEILRAVKVLAPDSSIYIFTLIGNQNGE